MKFLFAKAALHPCKFTTWPCMDYCYHVCPGAPNRSNNSVVIYVKMDESALEEKMEQWPSG